MKLLTEMSVKINNLKIKMIQMMISLITTDLLTNLRDTEILLKSVHLMTGIMMLVHMLTKRLETMLPHTELVVTLKNSGSRTTLCQDHISPFQEWTVLNK